MRPHHRLETTSDVDYYRSADIIPQSLPFCRKLLTRILGEAPLQRNALFSQLAYSDQEQAHDLQCGFLTTLTLSNAIISPS